MSSVTALKAPTGREVEVSEPRTSMASLQRSADLFRDRLKMQDFFYKAVVESLEKGIDYGELPSGDDDDRAKKGGRNSAGATEAKKPKMMLLKPGADRITTALGAQPRFTIVEQELDHDRDVRFTKRKKVWRDGANGRRTFDWKVEEGTARGFYRFVVKCEIVSHDTGAVLGEAIATCSSLEAKYCDRPREVENTLIQMACKRAHSASVLRATGLSGRFSGEGEPVDAGHDEDGVVADPTDGLTLEEALLMEINGQTLGSLRPKGLRAARTWCDGKLQDDPESSKMLRISAMIDMVGTFRVANPLPPRAEPAAAADALAAPPPAAADAATNAALESDDEVTLPF